jgi:hypothetical protein
MKGADWKRGAGRGFASGMACFLLILCGCEQRELCFDHEEEANGQELNLRFAYDLSWHESYDLYQGLDGYDLDWTEDEVTLEMGDLMESVYPVTPDGIRIQVMKGGEHYLTSNVGAMTGTIHLAEGDYSMLFYNNNTETIVFDLDVISAEMITASTRTRVRSTYDGNPLLSTRTDNTVTEPDVLFYSYLPKYTAQKAGDAETLDVVMEPAVFTYVIRFNFVRGLEHVALARGTLEGMAESVSLSDGTTSDVPATILYDCVITDRRVVAAVKSFGIPDYTPNTGVVNNQNRRSTREYEYGVTLELRLTNGALKTYYFDVTDQVGLQPNGGVITVGGIEIGDDEVKTSGSAFDVTIDDWGEYEDITLPLGK